MYRLRSFFLWGLWLVSCTTTPTASAPSWGTPVTYQTVTPSPTLVVEPVNPISSDMPVPTPTPFTYTVQPGDTLIRIAEKFGVSVEALQAANPQVSPNAMPVGTVLQIPSAPADLSGEATPTPAPLTIQQTQCFPDLIQGVWCFVLVHNDFADFIENISAQITLQAVDGQSMATQTAFLPLNILPPGMSLPLVAYFAPPVSEVEKVNVQILTAMRLSPNDERYLPATLDNILVEVDSSGRLAQVSGEVLLPPKSKAATQVWVAAVAYDASGRVVGVRRWEAENGIRAGERLPFSITVAGLGGAVNRVEVAVEARP